MRYTHWKIAAVAACMVACGPARTDEPVTTETAAGEDVSPSGDAAAERGAALVRMVNAVPGTGSLELMAEGKVLFASVPFKEVTEYIELTENATTLIVRDATSDSTLADNADILVNGSRYTVVAARNEDGKVLLRVLRDEVEPDSGRARVRVIHAAGGWEAADVMVAGTEDPIFNNVNFGSEAGPEDVQPTSNAMSVRFGDEGAVTKLSVTPLEAGKHYTIVLLRGSSGKAEVVTFSDATNVGADSLK
jgi:hypothetical protein